VVHPSQFTQAPYFLRYAGTPTVYYCHEVLRAAYEPGISSPIIRMGIRATLGGIDRRNVRAATTVASNSKFTSRRILEVYGRKSTPAAPGVDAQAFQPAGEKGRAYLLSVGAIHPLKGMDLLVEAVANLPQAVRPLLIIVGDRKRDRERERLQALARQRGVALEIRTQIEESELRGLYAGASAVLCAAHLEPLGLVPLEAMASGTPVVAVEEGGFRETVIHGKTGFLVSRNPKAFSEKVLWLLEHPGKAHEMGTAGRSVVVSDWSWERSVDRLLDVIGTVAGTR
jgi:glycosyltransferase involved in cell wall biosynthesis